MNQWSVRRLPIGVWAVHYNGYWHDTFATHAEAIIWAHRYAVSDTALNGALND